MSGATTLRQRPTIHGFWCVTGDPSVVDMAASVGPDFVTIDTQHGVDLGRLNSSLFTLLASYGVPGLVRVESIEAAPIGRALDLGAVGVVAPLVATAEEAERVVAATRHAPSGDRSHGMQTRRIGAFDEIPFVVIQVETAAAIQNIDAIAAVDGVDALYIGPSDLGLSLVGEPAPNVIRVFDGTHPNSSQLTAAFQAVVEAAGAHGIRPGLHCADGVASARAVEAGFTFTSVASDVGLIGQHLRHELQVARAAGDTLPLES